MLNARDYRNNIRFRNTDAELLLNLEALWLDRADYSARGHSQLTMFVAAVGLFAFGRLDVASDVLELLPPQLPGKPRINARIAVRVLSNLLPLPAHLDPMILDDHATIRAWIENHRSRLRWSETDGRYQLDP